MKIAHCVDELSWDFLPEILGAGDESNDLCTHLQVPMHVLFWLWIEINYFFLSFQFQVNTDLHTSLNTLLRWQCQKMNLWHSIAKLMVFQVCNRFSSWNFHAPTSFKKHVLYLMERFLDRQNEYLKTHRLYLILNGKRRGHSFRW